jgi:hypothetical protein
MTMLVVTNHAARRYVERVDPTCSLDDARAALEPALRRSIRIPRVEPRGCSIWRCVRPNCVLVVNLETVPPTLVTVLVPRGFDGRVV